MKASLVTERRPGFTYRTTKAATAGRELFADAIPVTSLARRYGTPLYIYSASTVRERYQQFEQPFRPCEHTICYSVKANSNLAILKILERLGAGFDVVSGGELQRVLAVSKKLSSRVVFSGVGKLVEEIDLAIRSGILLFNVESGSELDLLAARATHLRKAVNFAVRVNPDVAVETHPYISTGLHEHKFGVPIKDAAQLYRQVAKNTHLRAAGISVHIGSQIVDVAPFGEAITGVASLVRALRAEGHNIRYVDAGGGLGIRYHATPDVEFSAQTKRYGELLLERLRGLGVHLLLEPGRSIVGPAGILLTRVLYQKRNDGKQFLIVDAAMNDLIRPALYGAHHEIVPVVLHSKRPLEKVDIVGPICETADFFARGREIQHAEPGELLAILDAGAYGISLASNYNSRLRAAEVLVDRQRSRLIRRRESIKDLLAPERV